MNASTSFFEAGLTHYMALSGILLVFGLYIVLTKKNGIRLLMGLELILNAANLNLVSLNHYVDTGLGGQVFTIFVIILAACEVAIALAIVLSIYHITNTIQLDELVELKE